MSLCVRKPTICMGENKDADQLRGNREADQRLCFRYTDSTFPPLLKPKIFKILGFFCDCTGWFVLDLVGIPNCWFSHAQAHMYGIFFLFHYENLPMQYTEIFFLLYKIKISSENFDIFLIFAKNIDCGYTLELLRRGGSNEYPQFMFWSKNKYTPAYPSFSI